MDVSVLAGLGSAVVAWAALQDVEGFVDLCESAWNAVVPDTSDMAEYRAESAAIATLDRYGTEWDQIDSGYWE